MVKVRKVLKQRLAGTARRHIAENVGDDAKTVRGHMEAASSRGRTKPSY